MSRNVYFSQGVQSEKNLYEDIIIESIKIYGHEVFYMPRKIIQVDEILNEDVASRFDSAFNIEMYVENVDGYEGDGILMSKFGLEIRNQMKLVVSRKRWDASVGVWNAGYNNFRPSEGDLIYMPSVKGVFEIKFVELETPFYQLQNLPVYKITCELFEYSNEDIDTGVAEVDNLQILKTQDQTTYRSTFTYQSIHAAITQLSPNPTNLLYVGVTAGIIVSGMAITSTDYTGLSTSDNTLVTSNSPVDGTNNKTYAIQFSTDVTNSTTIPTIPPIGTRFGFSYVTSGQAAVNQANITLTSVVTGLIVGMRVGSVLPILLPATPTSPIYFRPGTRIIAINTTTKVITLSENLLTSMPIRSKVIFTSGFEIGETVMLTYPGYLTAIAEAEVLDVVEVTSIPGLSNLSLGDTVSAAGTSQLTIKTPAATAAAAAKAFPLAIGMMITAVTKDSSGYLATIIASAIADGTLIKSIISRSSTVTVVTISKPLVAAASYTTVTISPAVDNLILTLGTITFNDGIIHPLQAGVIVTSLRNSNTVSAKLVDAMTLVDDEDIHDGDIQSQNSVLEIKGNDYLDFTEINPFGEPNDG